MSTVGSFNELIVFQKAFDLAMLVFDSSRLFPKEEKFALTDQIRRSSRSVTACIAESWAKRKYPKAFISKLSDALGEEYETETWLKYSFETRYISYEEYQVLITQYDEVRKMLISMINNPDKWCH